MRAIAREWSKRPLGDMGVCTMFGRARKFKKININRTGTSTLIGPRTEIHGDVRFSARLHLEGTLKGNVIADENTQSVLTLTREGMIEGDVRVPNVILDGVVVGDIHANDYIELMANARITGNVYYGLIEIAVGAELNGNLIHRGEADNVSIGLDADSPFKAVEEA